jgi:hypothetical protein
VKRFPEFAIGMEVLWLFLFFSSVSSGQFFQNMIVWIPLLIVVNIISALLATIGFFHGNHKISIATMAAAALEFLIFFIALLLGLAAHTI